MILQINQGTIQYAGIEYITAIAKTAQSLASVPVIVHLSHGFYSYEMMAACIRHGFDSIMIDASKLPLADKTLPWFGKWWSLPALQGWL